MRGTAAENLGLGGAAPQPRSQRSWGFGDLADLKRLAFWSAELGAGIMLINPLVAPAPVVPQAASPYYPSSRRFRNPLYLRIEDVPGAAANGSRSIPQLAAEGRGAERLAAPGPQPRVQAEAAGVANDLGRWHRKRPLHRLSPRTRAAAGTICHLLRACRTFWAGLAHMANGISPARHSAVARFAAEHAPPGRLSCLAAMARRSAIGGSRVTSVGILQDLPIGFDPGGFGRLGVAGPAGRGDRRRRAARRVQRRRAELEPAGVPSGAASRGGL